MSEDEIDVRLQAFWNRSNGKTVRAPTLRDLWVEQCRVSHQDGQAEPYFDDLVAHFSWFFGEAA